MFPLPSNSAALETFGGGAFEIQRIVLSCLLGFLSPSLEAIKSDIGHPEEPLYPLLDYFHHSCVFQGASASLCVLRYPFWDFLFLLHSAIPPRLRCYLLHVRPPMPTFR